MESRARGDEGYYNAGPSAGVELLATSSLRLRHSRLVQTLIKYFMKANEGRVRGKISHMISKYFISEVEIRGNAHMLQFISGRLISF